MQLSVSKDRDKYYGGSDIPIIMGISPFKTRWELLQEKAKILENEFTGNEYTEYGNIMEPKIRDYINESQKDKFIEGKHIKDDIRIHTDGENKTTILEIKTTSQVHEKVDDYKIYLVQLLFYMQETKKKKGILAVYERPDDFDEEFDPFRLTTYEINIKDYKALLDDINLALEQFRIDLEKVRNNPFITEEDLYPKELVETCNKMLLLEEKMLDYERYKKQYENFKDHARRLMTENGMKTMVINDSVRFTNVLDSPDKEVEEDYYDEDRFIKENVELHQAYHNKLAEYKETRKVLKKGRKGYLKLTFVKQKNE